MYQYTELHTNANYLNEFRSGNEWHPMQSLRAAVFQLSGQRQSSRWYSFCIYYVAGCNNFEYTINGECLYLSRLLLPLYFPSPLRGEVRWWVTQSVPSFIFCFYGPLIAAAPRQCFLHPQSSSLWAYLHFHILVRDTMLSIANENIFLCEEIRGILAFRYWLTLNLYAQ